jgi:hypothetical protein
MVITAAERVKDRAGVWKYDQSEAEEVMIYCQQCKALQTIWLDGTAMMPTQKYTQQGNNIYHNCGSKHPCKLYYER